MALADGVLTPDEQQVLLKRAAELNLTPMELQMIIDARQYERQQRLQAQVPAKAAPKPATPPAPAPQPKANAGGVHRCPHCGAVINGVIGNCPECGITLTGVQANSAVQCLADKLEQIRSQSSSSITNKFLRMFELDAVQQRCVEAVRTFPVPTTKLDLVEFMTYCHTNYKALNHDPENRQLSKAWKAKRDECINKATIFFADDAEVQASIKTVQKSGNGFFNRFK